MPDSPEVANCKRLVSQAWAVCDRYRFNIYVTTYSQTHTLREQTHQHPFCSVKSSFIKTINKV